MNLKFQLPHTRTQMMPSSSGGYAAGGEGIRDSLMERLLTFTQTGRGDWGVTPSRNPIFRCMYEIEMGKYSI